MTCSLLMAASLPDSLAHLRVQLPFPIPHPQQSYRATVTSLPLLPTLLFARTPPLLRKYILSEIPSRGEYAVISSLHTARKPLVHSQQSLRRLTTVLRGRSRKLLKGIKKEVVTRKEENFARAARLGRVDRCTKAPNLGYVRLSELGMVARLFSD